MMGRVATPLRLVCCRSFRCSEWPSLSLSEGRTTVPNKKNMASRYATAHARRESRRRADARLRTGPVDAPDREMGDDQTPRAALGSFDRERATGSVVAPDAGPARASGGGLMAPPRSTREPVARPGGAASRPVAGRAPLPRPSASLASTVDYSYLNADLRRILLLSVSLLVLMIVLNLLLNR